MLGVLAALSGGPAGCSGPLQSASTLQLRASVAESARRELRDAERMPKPITPERRPGELSFPPERTAELEKMAGPAAYDSGLPALGADLLGEQTPAVRLDLRQAVARSVRGNLDVQTSRIDPAIGEAGVVAARAAFDWVFFTSAQWTSNDEPGGPRESSIPFTFPASVNQRVGYATGIRKQLTTGGTISISQGLTYSDDKSPGLTLVPDPSNSAFLELGIRQPLLRGFGSEVALAEVRLAENTERRSIHQLKGSLLRTVTQTEQAYWQLVQAQRELQILQRLLERGVETREVLRSRQAFDVKPAEFSDAVATVERRRADVIRAVNSLRQRSDALKALINDDQLTVGSETLLLAADEATDQPVAFSLLDSITQALAHRPEIQQAVLAIDDASIRQKVADNARLPLLDLALQSRFQGLASGGGDAYDDIGEARFVDFLVQLNFEQPIGNRQAEAGYRARQLERLRATVGYRQAVQSVVLEVKTAMRNVGTSYQLIEQTRSSRLAAAENLRTLLVLEKTTQSLTPSFLDLKFRRQEALAEAERDELGSLIGYNVALAQLAGATGTALQRNRISFVVPDAADPGQAPREHP